MSAGLERAREVSEPETYSPDGVRASLSAGDAEAALRSGSSGSLTSPVSRADRLEEAPTTKGTVT